jgi:hypothetical protein
VQGTKCSGWVGFSRKMRNARPFAHSARLSLRVTSFCIDDCAPAAGRNEFRMLRSRMTLLFQNGLEPVLPGGSAESNPLIWGTKKPSLLAMG